jgi:uncharacterized membrane protein
MVEGLTVLMRWLHMAAAACLTGGMIYGWIAVGAAATLDERARATVAERTADGVPAARHRRPSPRW